MEQYRSIEEILILQVREQMNRALEILEGNRTDQLTRVRRIARRRFQKMQEMRRTIKQMGKEIERLKEASHG